MGTVFLWNVRFLCTIVAPDMEFPACSFVTDRDPERIPLVLRILTVSFFATLFFTTTGIWTIDRYILRLDDVQWTILILIPWVLFILELTTAMVFQVIQGVLFSLQQIRR
jgi:hypothetical protein